MEIRFESGENDDDEGLRSLYRWLVDDTALRGQVRIKPVDGRPSSEQMGGGLDAIVALISGASAVAQLGISVAAWRQARGRRRNIVIVVPEEDRDAVKAVLDALQRAEDEK
jgi:hypothetical protein